MSDVHPAQRYGPTTGGVTGVIGLVAAAGFFALAFTGDDTVASVRVALMSALAAVLIWAYLLRPRIIVEAGGHTLLLRNPFVSVHIPLASVRSVAVRSITRVTTIDERRYDGIAVGYPYRNKIARIDKPPPRASRAGFKVEDSTLQTQRVNPAKQPVQELMTEQILAAADRAREARLPEEPVRRTYAIPEIVLGVGLAIGLVLTFV